jgi:hypothetical protein
MSVQIALITPSDIPHAITTIQSAFTDDPFNFFIYNRTSFSVARNVASLGIRLRWGIANGHVLVAHTPERRCAGVAMWVPPKPMDEGQTWFEWSQGWWLWMQQIAMNMWYGRGGLRVDVSSHAIKLIVEVLDVEGTTSGDAKGGLEGWQGVLVLEHLGDASG